jgi:hypothetical protein
MGFAEFLQDENKLVLKWGVIVGLLASVVTFISPKGNEYAIWIFGATILFMLFMALKIKAQRQLIDHLRDHPEDDPYMDGYCL